MSASSKSSTASLVKKTQAISLTPKTPPSSPKYTSKRCPKCGLLYKYDHVAWCRDQDSGWTCRCDKIPLIEPITPADDAKPLPQTPTPSETSLDDYQLIDSIQFLDNAFQTTADYQQFVKEHGKEWISTHEFQIFNQAYLTHRAIDPHISELKGIAKQISEVSQRLYELDIAMEKTMDKNYSPLKELGFEDHVFEFLYKKVPPAPTPIVTEKPRFQQTAKRTTPFPKKARHPQRPPSRTGHRCFLCNSPTHFKQNCPSYRCYYCGKQAPGHWNKDCPIKSSWDRIKIVPREEDSYPDDEGGYYDIYYEDDGNLNGEC
jgi:hypothetical protein